jgi:hypothetical protein
MGTSGSFGGSRSRGWSRARSTARNLPNAPSQEDINRLVADIASAIDFRPGDEVLPGDTPAGEADLPFAIGPVSWGPISARRRTSGRGAGGGGGRLGGTSGGPGPGTRGGGRRSGAVAARIASRGGGAAYALLRGDTAALADAGLVLAQLVGLAPAEQAQRIAAEVVGATIVEAERDKALSRMLVAILDSGGELAPADAAKVFVESYVYEVMLTEIDGELRDGRRDGAWIAEVERRVREQIQAVVANETLETGAGPGEIEHLTIYTLERARAVLAARTRRR